VYKKAAAIQDVITDHQLNFLVLSETWIRLDDPPAIANDAVPDGFKILNVARSSTSSDSKQNVGGGMAVIYRDDLTVCQHPLLDTKPAVTSFERQLVRVGSTTSFLAVVHLLLMLVSSSMNWPMCLLPSCSVVCCVAETSTARWRIAWGLDERQRRSWSSG